ncbi:MAG: hypothetical protein K940chlam3_01584, partial [Chlamydiae bacterium]|nr:hypothetical protein [Chlamydiota bacterium]
IPFLLFAQNLMAQEAEAPPRDFGSYQGLIIIAVGILFMYFILWRPEQKRRKALEEQREKLRTGDKVTAVGIIGRIDSIKEHTVVLKMVDGSKIEVLKAAISDVMPEEEKEATPES